MERVSPDSTVDQPRGLVFPMRVGLTGRGCWRTGARRSCRLHERDSGGGHRPAAGDRVPVVARGQGRAGSGAGAVRSAMKPHLLRLGCICMILTGCSFAGPALKVRDVEAKYGSTGAHWIGTRPVHIDSVLVIDDINDPATTGGRIEPSTFWPTTQGDIKWLLYAGAEREYVYIVPFGSAEQRWNFGPKQGDPTGMYAYERLPASDHRCKDFDVAQDAARAIATIGTPYRRSVPEGGVPVLLLCW